jgi:hypothetical protein
MDYKKTKLKTKTDRNTTVLVFALLFIVASFYLYTKLNDKTENPQQSQEQKDEEQKTPGINGLPLVDLEFTRPIAVVIENSPEARPQSGLSKADIVYETLAEGGITRFLAIFQSQKPEQLGPVRSARSYFNSWASELGAIYAHVGGHHTALTELENGIKGVSDANEFFNGSYFYRINSRAAPHNTYTTIDRLQALAKAKKYKTEMSSKDWKFKDDSKGEVTAKKLVIPFSKPIFQASYAYDSESNSYGRFIGGRMAVDAENNEQIKAKNVVVQVVRVWPMPGDDKLAILMDIEEGGNAFVYQDGSEIKGTWKVTGGRTRYYDESGKEIEFNRGQIWVEVIPQEMESSLAATLE